jgi:hypothetical protein
MPRALQLSLRAISRAMQMFTLEYQEASIRCHLKQCSHDLSCLFAAMTLQVQLLPCHFIHNTYTMYKIPLTALPLEFMTCRRQHECNRRPGKYCKARSGDIKTVIYMHSVKAVVYPCKPKVMRDILIDLHIALQVICGRVRRGQTDLLFSIA